MSLTTRVGLLAGASALMLTGVSYGDGPVEAKSTDARISELEAQIAGLKSESWMNEERAKRFVRSSRMSWRTRTPARACSRAV